MTQSDGEPIKRHWGFTPRDTGWVLRRKQHLLLGCDQRYAHALRIQTRWDRRLISAALCRHQESNVRRFANIEIRPWELQHTSAFSKNCFTSGRACTSGWRATSAMSAPCMSTSTLSGRASMMALNLQPVQVLLSLQKLHQSPLYTSRLTW